MNIPILIAGILCLLAFFAHAFAGDKEHRQLKPASDSEEKIRETWTGLASARLLLRSYTNLKSGATALNVIS